MFSDLFEKVIYRIYIYKSYIFNINVETGIGIK